MHWIRAALLIGFVACLAQADQVVLTNGSKFEGEILSGEGEFPIVIKTKGGKLTFPKRLVKSHKRDGSSAGSEAGKPSGGGKRPQGRPARPKAGGDADDQSYLALRRNYKTKLRQKGPAGGRYNNPKASELPDIVKADTYRSGSLELKVWYARRPFAPKPGPVLVFFHGGSALNLGTGLQICTPFIQKNFTVVFPTLRGENGNKGTHELACGEVDDALAAVKWAAGRPFASRSEVYALGYNLGGLTCSLLSLFPNAPLKSSASVEGLYGPRAIMALGKQMPFDVRIKQEVMLRSLVPHRAQMRHDHYAYVGRQNRLMHPALDTLKDDPRRKQLKLHVLPVDGAGEAVLMSAVRHYLASLE